MSLDPSAPRPPYVPPVPPAPPAVAPRPVPPPPRRTGGGTWVWITLVLVLVLGLAAVVIAPLWMVGRAFSGEGLSVSSARMNTLRPRPLVEVVLEQAPGDDKIAVIDLDGVISAMPLDRRGYTLVDYVRECLDRAAEDDAVRAVLLRVDSPGGEVLASDEIYRLLAAFQDRKGQGKPVIASLGSLAASGGYYVAAPSRWIVANELTITGSIGVIMQSFNFRGLMDKVGVRSLVFKSGELKDMLSSFKDADEVTPEEKAILQNLVDESFTRFKTVVEEGRGLAAAANRDGADSADRGRPLARDWADYADGRILTGREAHRLGFVDELGNFETAKRRARRLAQVEHATLIRYVRPVDFGSLFSLFGRAEQEDAARVRIDLGFDVPRLEAGKLYFLSPAYLR